jgi:hypothetical protein
LGQHYAAIVGDRHDRDLSQTMNCVSFVTSERRDAAVL